MYTNDADFTNFYTMKITKNDAPNALILFLQDIGIPAKWHSDNTKELTLRKWVNWHGSSG